MPATSCPDTRCLPPARAAGTAAANSSGARDRASSSSTSGWSSRGAAERLRFLGHLGGPCSGSSQGSRGTSWRPRWRRQPSARCAGPSALAASAQGHPEPAAAPAPGCAGRSEGRQACVGGTCCASWRSCGALPAAAPLTAPGHNLLSSPCQPTFTQAEVVEFCRYLAPSPAEQASRQAAIDAIEDVVTSIWPKARVQVFGSFATGVWGAPSLC